MRNNSNIALALLSIAWLAKPIAAANVWIEAESFSIKADGR